MIEDFIDGCAIVRDLQYTNHYYKYCMGGVYEIVSDDRAIPTFMKLEAFLDIVIKDNGKRFVFEGIHKSIRSVK